MVVGRRGLAWKRLHDGSGQPVGHLQELSPRAERTDAGEDDDLLAGVQDLRRSLQVLAGWDGSGRAVDRRGVRWPGDPKASLIRLEVGVGLLNVHGEGQVGDVASGQGRADGQVHERGNADRDVDHRVVGGQIHEHPVQVHLLLVAGAEVRGGLHPGDRQHRGVVQLGVVEPVDEMQAARTRRRQAHAEPSGGLRVAGGHERRGLLVVDQDERDLVPVTAEPFHDPVDAVAGEPEDGVDPPMDQSFDQQFRSDLLAHAWASLLIARRENRIT